MFLKTSLHPEELSSLSHPVMSGQEVNVPPTFAEGDRACQVLLDIIDVELALPIDVKTFVSCLQWAHRIELLEQGRKLGSRGRGHMENRSAQP